MLNKNAIEALLEKVKRISKKYGLALNRDKCVNLNMSTAEEQVFADGQKINGETNTVYLGNELNTQANIRGQVSNRIREVSKTWFKQNETVYMGTT